MQNGLIDPVTLTFDLLTPKAYHFEYIPWSFPTQSLNTLGSFDIELCCGQTNKQTGKQTNRWSRTSYPRRLWLSVGVGSNVHLLSCSPITTITYPKSVECWQQGPQPANKFTESQQFTERIWLQLQRLQLMQQLLDLHAVLCWMSRRARERSGSGRNFRSPLTSLSVTPAHRSAPATTYFFTPRSRSAHMFWCHAMLLRTAVCIHSVGVTGLNLGTDSGLDSSNFVDCPYLLGWTKTSVG